MTTNLNYGHPMSVTVGETRTTTGRYSVTVHRREEQPHVVLNGTPYVRCHEPMAPDVTLTLDFSGDAAEAVLREVTKLHNP